MSLKVKRVCPMPARWNELYIRLLEHAQAHACSPASPPVPLILTGWVFSNDTQKSLRWEETQTWASANGCKALVDSIPDEDYYVVDQLTTYAVGPFGGPMYLEWDSEPKPRPTKVELQRCLNLLSTRWPEVAGADLAAVTEPLSFSGAKARRLVVRAEAGARAPWGDWNELSKVEQDRRAFTRLREAVNAAIAPHEVDHVDFLTSS